MSDPGANNLTRDEAIDRADLVGEVSYRVHLDFDRGGEVFGSKTEIEFSCPVGEGTSFVDLIARDVRSISLNGREIGKEAVSAARIKLEGLRDRNVLKVEADCEYTNTGVGIHRFIDPKDGHIYTYSDFEPFEAHRAFACFDQPDIKGTFEFSVTVPGDWLVISCTKPVETGRTWRFEVTPRISTYITAVVAGPYHEVIEDHRGISLGVYCRQSLKSWLDAEEFFNTTKAGFDFFESEFGYKYPIDKYDQVFCPEYNQGAMENLGCVTYHEQFIFRSKQTDWAHEKRAETILHEMAHMWFGDLVTMRWWEDLWLNESFATYASLVALVKATRFKNAWTTFTNGWKTWAMKVDQLPTTHPIQTEMIDTDSVRENFDGIAYAKGCSALRQLVAWVGEDAFRKGCRDYFRKFEYSNAELRDFLACLEENSGRDLGAWSKEWLESSGLNVIEAGTRVTDGKYDSFTVFQYAAQDECPTLRSHRIGIGLYDQSEGRLILRKRIETDVSGPETSIPELYGDKVPDLLLLNDEELTFAKVRLDERSVEALRSGISTLDSSLIRALAWASLWNMVTDAKIPARQYVHMVLEQGAQETEVSLVEGLLQKASDAVSFFVSPSHFDATIDLASSTALATARAAEHGSDLQLQWFRFFVATASTPEAFDLVHQFLEGEERIEGLEIDDELRWHLVRVLSAGDRLSAEEIEREASRVGDDEAQRHAAWCKALRPLPEAKEEAFERLIEEDTPLAMMKALMMGLMPQALSRSQMNHWTTISWVGVKQQNLLLPLVDRYLESLEPLSRARSNVEVSGSFADFMFPRHCLSDEVVSKIDDYIESCSLPPHLLRPIRDGRDNLVRAVRARSKDSVRAQPPC